MVVINELSFERSMQALSRLEQRSLATVRIEAVLRRLLDAETAVRGYLLTGRRLYLAPYELAASDVAEGQRWLRHHNQDDAIALGLLQRLSVQADAALADMETTLRAFDAGERRLLQWQDRLGRQPMERVRSLSAQLLQREHEHIARQRQAVFDTLQFSRIGVDLMAAMSVLALLVVLRQTAALDAAQRRHALALREHSGRLEDEVQRRSDDLTELAKHLQTVREDESNRLAHVLHEELGALLTTAKLDLARLRGQLSSAPPEVHQRLAQLSASIDSGITLKRRIIDGLRPLSLSNLGLVSALQLQLRQLAERTGLKVHGELQSLALSETSQITIYRLVQEALTNIAKYAHATQVTVQLARAVIAPGSASRTMDKGSTQAHRAQAPMVCGACATGSRLWVDGCTCAPRPAAAPASRPTCRCRRRRTRRRIGMNCQYIALCAAEAEIVRTHRGGSPTGSRSSSSMSPPARRSLAHCASHDFGLGKHARPFNAGRALLQHQGVDTSEVQLGQALCHGPDELPVRGLATPGEQGQVAQNLDLLLCPGHDLGVQRVQCRQQQLRLDLPLLLQAQRQFAAPLRTGCSAFACSRAPNSFTVLPRKRPTSSWKRLRIGAVPSGHAGIGQHLGAQRQPGLDPGAAPGCRVHFHLPRSASMR